MKFPIRLVIGLVALLQAVSGETTNPVSRVVALLQSLSTKLEKELKEETAIFKKYECWKKSVVAAKAASNEAAQSRIDSLETYIADIEAGRIEFTTERADLEKQISSLQGDLATAKALREQEKGDYEAAKAEMEQAVAALKEAITVMKEGTAASLLSKRKRTSSSMVDVKDNLQRAIQISRQVLSFSESKQLTRILQDEVPSWDWKKLNRKATYKMKYKASSGSIIETLEQLEKTFQAHLDEAIEKEAQAETEYGKLKGSKDDMLATAQKSLVDMIEEGGARGLSKSEAQAEVTDLKAQIVADTKFSDEAEAAYQTKLTEWEARKTLRGNEILSCSKALAVLHSDDARDLFKKSYASQGYSLLEDRSTVATVSMQQCQIVRDKRADALMDLARVVKDVRAMSLVSSARQGSIDAVIVKVDELIKTLEGEEEEDLAKKEKCETDISTNAQDARMASLAIDTYTEDIERAKSKAEEIQAQLEEENATIAKSQEELKTMQDMRDDEKRKYAADKLDDQGAIQLLEMAIAIMKKWSEGGGDVTTPPAQTVPTLVQLSRNASTPRRTGLAVVKQHVGTNHSAKQPVEVEAGLAPPPPPATWDDPTYAGAGGESQGIHALLELIKTDIEADITSADKAEEAAAKAFTEQEKTINDAIKASQDAVTQYELDKAEQEQTALDKGSERASKKTELDSTIELIKGMRPGCDYIAVNYEVRTKKRQIEIDGLKSAKAILQGADFPTMLQNGHKVSC